LFDYFVDVVFDDLVVHEVVEFVEKVDDVDWEAVDGDVVEVGDVTEKNRRRVELFRIDLRQTALVMHRYTDSRYIEPNVV